MQKIYGKTDADGWVMETVSMDAFYVPSDSSLIELIGWLGHPEKGNSIRPRVVAGAVQYQDPRNLDQIRAEKWSELKTHRSTLDYLPMNVDGIDLDATDLARVDFLGAILSMQIKGQTARAWRCTDNVMRDLTLAQIIQAGMGIADRRDDLIRISDTLYQALQTATTADEVSAIVWPTPTTAT
jgi:hypothetical protein